ncbi:uncharacterized protein N7529_001638 [Penicillium soppii]|uniref:uncharacterized protein n=1 Tax=Penicillium soppii TaxID=69789 RepID=UPI00254714E1|nr:uncharacterized protein N7529_001638 [Penicillium soppii]KAJ5876054.1 hypothetical protein N7529_001638 [Penicillium soppii]
MFDSKIGLIIAQRTHSEKPSSATSPPSSPIDTKDTESHKFPSTERLPERPHAVSALKMPQVIFPDIFKAGGITGLRQHD